MLTRAKEVCKALEYNKRTAHVLRAHASVENYAHKYDVTSACELAKGFSKIRSLH